MMFCYLQRATDGIERAAYEKLIAPFKYELPISNSDGFRRACDEHKYAYIGDDFFKKLKSSTPSCQLMSLPGTSYPETETYIISKTSHYKRLISWRSVPHTNINTTSLVPMLSYLSITTRAKLSDSLDVRIF
jgi:hypothetical protein